jgi:hypothetical protein
MKKFVEEDSGIIMPKDAKPGFIYGVLGEEDLAIVHNLGGGGYGLSSLVVGKKVEEYDEMVWKSLEAMVSSLLDQDYEVFSFSSINEFAQWADKLDWDELRPIEPKEAVKFTRVDSSKTAHAIDRIVYGDDNIFVDTLCGLQVVFDKGAPMSKNYLGWSLHTRTFLPGGKRRCGNCEIRPKFISWQWPDLESIIKIKN